MYFLIFTLSYEHYVQYDPLTTNDEEELPGLLEPDSLWRFRGPRGKCLKKIACTAVGFRKGVALALFSARQVPIDKLVDAAMITNPAEDRGDV